MAAGDPIFIKRVQSVTLSNPEKAALLYEATTDPVTYYQFKLQGRVDKLTGIE